MGHKYGRRCIGRSTKLAFLPSCGNTCGILLQIIQLTICFWSSLDPAIIPTSIPGRAAVTQSKQHFPFLGPGEREEMGGEEYLRDFFAYVVHSEFQS